MNTDHMIFDRSVNLSSGNVCRTGLAFTKDCTTLQHVTIGEEGTVRCAVKEEFLAVLWYHNDAVEPVMIYSESEKSGDGYEKNEYDILPNGSLIINNVSVEHEGTFRVTQILAISEPSVTHIIQIRTVGRSL